MPTETCLIALCQIITFGNALQPELWPFLDPMLALIFMILDILRCMRVYDGISRYLEVYVRNMQYMGYMGYMTVYEII